VTQSNCEKRAEKSSLRPEGDESGAWNAVRKKKRLSLSRSLTQQQRKMRKVRQISFVGARMIILITHVNAPRSKNIVRVFLI
jgi:hypothetical protein